MIYAPISDKPEREVGEGGGGRGEGGLGGRAWGGDFEIFWEKKTSNSPSPGKHDWSKVPKFSLL